MRTNIVLDDALVAEAQRITGARTKREVVELGLRELVAREKRLGVLALKGKVRWEGDLDVSRMGR
jgi:Arc/MetJ family transcription regulator